MNAVIDRAPYGVVTGEVKVNGITNGLKNVKNIVGFVPQDDTVHGNLTVFQNLYYSAMLRLPSSGNKADKIKHVQAHWAPHPRPKHPL